MAVPDFVVSATDTAEMVTLEGLGATEGAVYNPEELIVPTVEFPPCIPPALQVTLVLVVPVTLAV
jgi:hypothetical protein